MEPPRLGPYRLVRRIASGGMAEIFLAERADVPSGAAQRLVVKRLFRELAAHASVLRAFRREAEVMATVSHPGVPRVLDAGRDGPDWFIAMDHVEGVALATRAGGVGPPWPWEAALSVGHQLAAIMDAVHTCRDTRGDRLGLVHGDVNPNNILVRPDGTLALVDFGVATLAADGHPKDAPRGTLRYMAPEQITGGPIDARADLHAWGAILFEMTTGRPLRAGPDPQVLVDAVERDPTPPSTWRPDCPPALDALVRSCLARAPAERPPQASHLRAAAEEIARRHGWTLAPRAVAAWVREGAPCP
jgi:eukaryotic-like serine/threonine-protein kinase